MSLERKDIRAKLDPDVHGALAVLAEVDQCDIGEWIERELVAVIKRRVHDAKIVATRVARLGITGNSGE
jgi:hypothetical protein